MTTGQKADMLVKGGLLVTGRDISRQDVLIRDGLVQELGSDLSLREASRVIDATGKYVLPGAIDSHSHPVYSDRMDEYSICAAYGGITTVIAFVGNVTSWGFSGYTTDVIKEFIEEGERLSYLDFSVHGTYVAADEDTLARSVPELIRMGVISFKVFLAYSRRGMMISEEGLIKVMDLAARDGGLPMVHAENGCCIDYLIDKFTAEGKTSSEWFLPAQPNILEAEGLNRAAVFSQIVGAPLYPVHLSTHEAMPLVRRFREQGLPIFTETCPHYLTLTNDEILKKGAVAKVGPPLRQQEDIEALWQGVADGALDVIASDSGGFTKAQKLTGGMTTGPVGDTSAGRPLEVGENIFEARFGLNTVEFMVPVVWSHGVNRGRITLPRLVQVFCENPAKIFGLYPKKGVLLPGSDADLVVWDPARVHVVDRQHGNTDFSSFEGFELLGMPDLTMQRGDVIMENGQIMARPGRGRFLPGDPNAAAYAPRGHKTV
jgi:dihydropyrimidinase